jgi:EAL and modified HD-GYP domain-containing signal transduction protein
VTLEELSVSEEIKNALLHGKGKSGALISLVRNYEKADWQGVTNYSCMLRIPYNLVSQKYIESVEHVNEIWNQLMIPYSSSND